MKKLAILASHKPAKLRIAEPVKNPHQKFMEKVANLRSSGRLKQVEKKL